VQILKRAKNAEMDIVSVTESEKNVREEVLRRNAKAGYTTRYGEPTYSTKIQVTVPFGEQKLNIWPRDENGKLIGE